jgi:hypothetical protein
MKRRFRLFYPGQLDAVALSGFGYSHGSVNAAGQPAGRFDFYGSCPWHQETKSSAWNQD